MIGIVDAFEYVMNESMGLWINRYLIFVQISGWVRGRMNVAIIYFAQLLKAVFFLCCSMMLHGTNDAHG